MDLSACDSASPSDIKQELIDPEDVDENQDYKDVLNLANRGDDYGRLNSGGIPDENRISDVTQIKNSGVPLDWLLRSRTADSMESSIHLLSLYDTWFHKFNTKVLIMLLKKYEEEDGKLLLDNKPPRLSFRRRSNVRASGDEPEVVDFVKRLLKTIESEPVIWQKVNATQGFHRALRVAWLNVSLQLGGWGSREHISYLKGLYRRKRDMYNGEYLRGKIRVFQYAGDMKFLDGSLERYTYSGEGETVQLSHFVSTCMPNFDFNSEVENAPPLIKNLIAEMMEEGEKIRKELGEEALAAFYSKCVNGLHQFRENSALGMVSDEQWPRFCPKE